MHGTMSLKFSDYYIHVFASVRMVHLGCHWTDFHKIRYLSIFLKFIEKITVLLKSNENEGFFNMETNIHFRSYLDQFFLE